MRASSRASVASAAGLLPALLLAFALAGCGGGQATPAPTPVETGAASASGAAAASAVPTAAATALDDIPPGRAIPEGGGGPSSYTFREEWRRARAEAQRWRAGAYLVAASGNFVNDDGVPSSWTLDFTDGTSPVVAFMVGIDPWGKVTETHEVAGDAAVSLLGPNAGRIPYGIIDSDKAVGLGKADLSSRYDLGKTNAPSLGLRYSEVDGGGPYWTYTLFYEPAADYIPARMDALTGAVAPAQ